MNFRSNRMPAAAGAVFLLVTAAELVWLGLGVFSYSAAGKELNRNTRRLERLERRDPYPSAANLSALEENLDVLEYQVGELRAVMGRDPIPDEHADAAELSARIQEKVELFRKHAEEAGVELPDTLEAGFSEYASGGAVAAQADVPRLMRQLHSVSVLADVLIEAGVNSIEGISRERFEFEAEPETPRRRRPNSARAPRQRLPASEVGPDGLYMVERIGVEFSADENEVWRVLEGLASSPRFMIVTGFSHQTDTDILDYSPLAVTRGAETDDEALNYLREGILRGKKALSRPERIIAGADAVRVRMTVDVYNFNPEVPDGRGR